jgi:flagellar protein FliO/FliZ
VGIFFTGFSFFCYSCGVMMFNAKIFVPDETGALAQASETSQEAIFQSANNLPPGDYGLAFVKMFLTLLVLIALFGVTIWFVKRLIRAKLERGAGTQMIEILEKKMISPKTMLYVVEVEGKKILLAESQIEVRPLAEIASLDSDPSDQVGSST